MPQDTFYQGATNQMKKDGVELLWKKKEHETFRLMRNGYTFRGDNLFLPSEKCLLLKENITKIRLFKYIVNFTTKKKGKFSDKKF